MNDDEKENSQQWLDVRDVIVFGGIGIASYGIWLIYIPAAYIFCGLSLFWLGAKR